MAEGDVVMYEICVLYINVSAPNTWRRKPAASVNKRLCILPHDRKDVANLHERRGDVQVLEAKELELNLKTLLHVNKRLFLLPHDNQRSPDVDVAARHTQGVLAAYADLGFQNRLVDFKGLVVFVLVGCPRNRERCWPCALESAMFS